MAFAWCNVQGEQVRAKTREIVEVNKRESIRQDKITAATRDLATAEEELANLPAYEPPTKELVSNSMNVEVCCRIRLLPSRVCEKIIAEL